jgi:ACS family D-galactonate transporter-like MFS transporter
MSADAVVRTPVRQSPWLKLAVLALGFAAMSLNWFDMPAAFPGIHKDLHASVPELALLVSAFVIGYGVMHIPAGFLAARFGLRAVLTAGLVLEGLLNAASGLAHNYPTMIMLRIACGLAASNYAGVGIAAVSVWFRGTREHAFALGVVSASFALGVTVGLSAWVAVVEATTWRVALMIAGGIAVAAGVLIISIYRIPPNAEALRGGPLTMGDVRRVLRSRVLWRYGLAFFGGYGAYFTAAQLLRVYATAIHVSSASISVAVVLIGLAGIPGSTLAGWLSDRAGTRRPYVVGFLLIQALGLVLIPECRGFLWLPAIIVGFGFNGCFAVFQSTAGEDPNVSIEHIGTAIGLMLTISAIGGFIVPAVFGRLAVSAGYTAAWIFAGVVCCAFALLAPARAKATAAQEPSTSVMRDGLEQLNG